MIPAVPPRGIAERGQECVGDFDGRGVLFQHLAERAGQRAGALPGNCGCRCDHGRVAICLKLSTRFAAATKAASSSGSAVQAAAASRAVMATPISAAIVSSLTAGRSPVAPARSQAPSRSSSAFRQAASDPSAFAAA